MGLVGMGGFLIVVIDDDDGDGVLDRMKERVKGESRYKGARCTMYSLGPFPLLRTIFVLGPNI